MHSTARGDTQLPEDAPISPGERDDAAGERDADAERRDHTASERDLEGVQRDADAERRDHTADERDVEGGQRDADAGRRDESAATRDLTGELRDQAGERRDRAAEQRDKAADSRDREAELRDREADHMDRVAAARSGVRAQGAAPVAGARWAYAAADRRRANEARRAAAVERKGAALDRRAAYSDRIAGAGRRDASVLDRGVALADRGTALADRVAQASGRGLAGLDRGTALADRGVALDDRAAAALDRLTASRFAALELRIAESEARAFRLLQAVPDPVVVVDASGNIELINSQAVLLFGYQADEMIGQPVERLVPVGLRQVHREHHAAYIASEHPTPMSTGPNVVAVHKDGTTIPVEINLSAIALSTGRAVLASIRDVSDRKLADAELRLSDERFRVSFDSAPIGMALVDLEPERAGRFLRVNKAFCGLTGLSAAELLLTSSAAITHPDDADQTTENLQRLAAGAATSWDTEKRYVTTAGEVVWVHLAISVVHHADGSPAFGVEQVENITDRRRTQAQMQERFRELATNVDVGFLLRQIDPPEDLYVNPAYLTVFGFDPDAPTPDPTASTALATADDVDRVAELLRAAASGRRVEQEWRFTRPDGGKRWVSGRVSPIADDDGKIRRVAGLFEDVTRRKDAEEALRASEQLFDQLARNTEVGFFLRSPTEMLYMNEALSRIFGVDHSVANPSVATIHALIHPADREVALEVSAAADRGESTQSEFRVIRPDGQLCWISATNDPVTTAPGEPNRVAGTVTDITGRKAAEDAVLSARIEAERANTAKDEFLSRMSHELRTPLNAVLGFAQLLEIDDLVSRQADAVGHILRGGRHLVAMIDDILDITGIEADRFELSPEPVGIDEIISDAVGLMQPVAAATSITLGFAADQPAAARYVRADRRRLKQVLLNLVSNAIKYNVPGGRVDIAVTVDGDDQARIAVIDTGMGIPAADVPRLFHAFDRLGRQSSAIEGTGIGLLLSKRLTTLMGGRLEVETTAGIGSTFSVILPIARPGDGPVDARVTFDAPPVDSVALSRLVYIEDNPSNVDLLTSMMRRRPTWAMSLASTGTAGIALAVELIPSVVLLDLHLPDVDGIAVLHALKANPATADIPVAILSADANANQAARLLAAGAEIYLTKPLNVREVFDFLDTHSR